MFNHIMGLEIGDVLNAFKNILKKSEVNSMKTTIAKVIVSREDSEYGPLCEGFRIEPETEGGGSFLSISAEDDQNNGSRIVFNWDEWDEIVKVVAQYRKEWENLE